MHASASIGHRNVLQSLHPKPLPWLGYFKAGQVCHTSTRLVVINFQMLQVLCAEVNGGTSVHTYVRNLPWALYVGVSHIHTYTRTNIPIHIHTYLHTYIRTYIHAYADVRICIYTYIYKPVHTYRNTCTLMVALRGRSCWSLGIASLELAKQLFAYDWGDLESGIVGL